MTAPYYLHLFYVLVLKIPACHLYSSHVTVSSGKLQFRTISTCYVPSVILSLVLFLFFFFICLVSKIMKDNILFMADLILFEFSLNASYNIFLKR